MIVVASWNVLAAAYVRADWFPFSSEADLDPERRFAAVVERAAGLDADVLCLQEVERPCFEALRARLEPLGYSGHLGMKGHGKPDGCAAFIRTDGAIRVVAVERVAFDDGTGHLALIAELEVAGRAVSIAGTHLKWHGVDTPAEERFGLGQMRTLLDAWPARPGTARVLCGDLNAPPGSEVIELVGAAGLLDAFADRPDAMTTNSNRRPKRIDWIFHDADLLATPRSLPAIEAETPLPGPGEPSDHLPVVASLAMRGRPGGA